MRTAITRTLFAMIGVLMALSGAQGQEISGFSSIGLVSTCTGGGFTGGCTNPRKGASLTYTAGVSAYVDTEEDYTASLYYDVSSVSAAYYGGSPTPLTSGSITGNPSATTKYSVPGTVLNGTVRTSFTSYGYAPNYNTTTYINDITPGIFTEATDHVVDFFYVTSVGEYYDPYGYSLANGDGDYNSGYWFSVTVYGTYLEEASVVLGESYDSTDNNANSALQGPSITTASYQSFIPPAWIYGPPTSGCPLLQTVIYAGDNRGFDPTLESYRLLQAISLGIGGLTSVYPANAPPVESTGWTYQFSSAVLQNNQIPPTAYNLDYLGDCSSLGINELGHQSTSGFISPGVIYNGTSSTQTTFEGSATDPLPVFAFPISWDVPLTLTEPSSTDLHVSGSLNSTCYPAHEVSVGGVDLNNGGTYMPGQNNLPYITGCLSGTIPNIHQPINQDINLVTP